MGRRTDLDMVDSGQWVKTARKHYTHVSGAEIVYNCMTWSWEIKGAEGVRGTSYDSLGTARYEVERAA